MKKFRGVYLKNEQEIAIMREANRIVSRILDALGREVRPGIQTMFFEEMAQELCAEYKVAPAFQGYHGYPFALCCSVNEEIVHGFPSKRILNEGDIVSFDMGVILDGFFGDSARTYTVGEISDKAMDLLEVTRNSLLKGIAQAREGNTVQDISRAIQGYVESKGYNVVKRFVGHGIGRRLHEKPEVPNFVPLGAQELPLKAGMVLAIEPMVTMGQSEVDILADNWTAVTKDRQLSAHFEHTVAVTKNGPEILSVSD